MVHHDFDRMARDMYRQAIEQKLGLTLPDRSLYGDGVSVRLIARDGEKFQYSVGHSSVAYVITVHVWLVMHSGYVHASACITRYDNLLQELESQPMKWATAELFLSKYEIECDDCN